MAQINVQNLSEGDLIQIDDQVACIIALQSEYGSARWAIVATMDICDWQQEGMLALNDPRTYVIVDLVSETYARHFPSPYDQPFED